MNAPKSQFRRGRRCRGQGLVEYILIIASIAVVVIAVLTATGHNVASAFGTQLTGSLTCQGCSDGSGGCTNHCTKGDSSSDSTCTTYCSTGNSASQSACTSYCYGGSSTSISGCLHFCYAGNSSSVGACTSQCKGGNSASLGSCTTSCSVGSSGFAPCTSQCSWDGISSDQTSGGVSGGLKGGG